jgi:hypothetical protein
MEFAHWVFSGNIPTPTALWVNRVWYNKLLCIVCVFVKLFCFRYLYVHHAVAFKVINEFCTIIYGLLIFNIHLTKAKAPVWSDISAIQWSPYYILVK